MRFNIEFHGPLRVGTGEPGQTGADLGVDPRDPLPATSIKGVLRAAAVGLGVPEGLVNEVFGAPGHPSPWWFSAGREFEWQGNDEPVVRAQVAIDDATGTAQDRAFHLGEELWPISAHFLIEPLEHLDGDTATRHRDVLTLAAMSTHSLGAGRRRGLGWVTITAEPSPSDDDLRRAISLLGGVS